MPPCFRASHPPSPFGVHCVHCVHRGMPGSNIPSPRGSPEWMAAGWIHPPCQGHPIPSHMAWGQSHRRIHQALAFALRLRRNTAALARRNGEADGLPSLQALAIARLRSRPAAGPIGDLPPAGGRPRDALGAGFLAPGLSTAAEAIRLARGQVGDPGAPNGAGPQRNQQIATNSAPCTVSPKRCNKHRLHAVG